jgi:uncharacterized Zn finger protein
MNCPNCGGELVWNSKLQILLKCKKCGSLWAGEDLANLSKLEGEKVILT